MICNDVSIVNLRPANKAADVQVNVITIFGNVVVPIRMMQWQTSYHCIHVPQSLGACPAKPYQKPQRPAYLRFRRPLIGTANSEGNLAAAKLLDYINGLPRKTPLQGTVARGQRCAIVVRLCSGGADAVGFARRPPEAESRRDHPRVIAFGNIAKRPNAQTAAGRGTTPTAVRRQHRPAFQPDNTTPEARCGSVASRAQEAIPSGTVRGPLRGPSTGILGIPLYLPSAQRPKMGNLGTGSKSNSAGRANVPGNPDGCAAWDKMPYGSIQRGTTTPVGRSSPPLRCYTKFESPSQHHHLLHFSQSLIRRLDHLIKGRRRLRAQALV